jgi:putative hydrolase of the HAD superfamily
MSNHIKALLFDLGGVVVEVAGARAALAWAGLEGRHVQVPAAPHVTVPALHEAYLKHERGQLSDSAFFAEVRRELGLSLSEQQILQGWNAIIGDEIAGIRDLLERADARYPVFAFSNTNSAHIAHVSTRHKELLAKFRKLYLSHEIGLRKPDREAFIAVVAAMGVSPSDVLFFDDNLANVEGARAVGMAAVHVRTIEDVVAAIDALPGVRTT